jgi:hypothetical protein
MSSKHSIISPSSAYRWLNCPGSARAEAKYPDESSEYAQEGTDAHRLFEKCILKKVPALHYLGSNLLREDGGIFQVTDEMVENIQWCLDYVFDLNQDSIQAETKYELPFVHKELAGTCDVTIREPFGELTVIDLKYGQGVDVEAVGNPQLMIYALGALGELDKTGVESFETVKMVILQPRKSRFPKEWVVSPHELRTWADRTLKPGAEKAVKGSKSFRDGEWCKFCKVNKHLACPKINNKALELFTNEEKIPLVKDFSPEQMSNILKNLPRFDEWRKNLEEQAFQVMMDGGEIPGFKLVEGRSVRKWKDEEEAKSVLKRLCPGEDFMETKFMSLAQVEKKLKALNNTFVLFNFSELVIKPEGKPTIVSVEDKRPALEVLTATELFEKEYLK